MKVNYASSRNQLNRESIVSILNVFLPKTETIRVQNQN